MVLRTSAQEGKRDGKKVSRKKVKKVAGSP